MFRFLTGLPLAEKNPVIYKYEERTALCMSINKKTKKNSVALVRKRTIPTERPPLVGEISANLCGYRGRCVVSTMNSHGR
jgi:hypothetical protein